MLSVVKARVMGAEEVRSVMFTGAPAVGKTTQQLLLTEDVGRHRLGLDYTTRGPRKGEIHGVHRNFVSREDFVRRFNMDHFFEPDLDFAEYDGNYYGTPKEWVNLINQKSPPLVVVPVSVQIAKEVKDAVGPQLLWVHLHCSRNVRAKRLTEERGLTGESLRYRLSSTYGDTFGKISQADISIDTGIQGKFKTLQTVAENL